MNIYTTGQVAEKLGVTIPTVRKEIENNNLIAFKVGSEYRITQQALDLYIGVSDYENEIARLKAELRDKNKFIAMIKSVILEANYENTPI